MILTCADNGEVGEHLHWTTWTSTEATATGTVAWRTGSATLADSKSWSTVTADFTLNHPVSGTGNKVLFTSLDVTITGSTPEGFRRSQAFDEAPLPKQIATTPSADEVPAASRGTESKQGSAIAAASSGTLGYADIEGYWDLAGGPDDEAETAAAITGAEASFYPGIIQQGVDYCGAGADRAGWGLWQITCGNEVPAYGTDFQLLDPWNNAEAAVYLYDADEAEGVNGFTPWTTYETGAYETYLQDTAANTAVADPGQYVQDGSTPSGTPASPAADPGSTYGPGIPSTAVTEYYQASFQANNNSLTSFNSAADLTTTGLGMEAGTNPASAQLSDGTFMAAFEDNDNDLYFYKWSTEAKTSTSYGMDSGTSPALAALPTSAAWVAAFQSNNHYLYIDESNGDLVDTGLPMEAGTSPAIAVQPDGDWDVAFTSNDGLLTTYDSAGNSAQTSDGMNTATSPSIASLANGTYEVAFEANNNNLSLYHTGGSTDNTAYGMDADTSPSIASHASSGDWEVAWQANSNELGTADAAGNSLEISDGLYPGTSVSVAPYGASSYEIAFEANNDYLGIYHAGGTTKNTTYGMDAGTSPSLAIPAP
jgi:hypothetical protein